MPRIKKAVRKTTGGKAPVKKPAVKKATAAPKRKPAPKKKPAAKKPAAKKVVAVSIDAELGKKSLLALKRMCGKLGVTDCGTTKAELIVQILDAQALGGDAEFVEIKVPVKRGSKKTTKTIEIDIVDDDDVVEAPKRGRPPKKTAVKKPAVKKTSVKKPAPKKTIKKAAPKKPVKSKDTESAYSGKKVPELRVECKTRGIDASKCKLNKLELIAVLEEWDALHPDGIEIDAASEEEFEDSDEDPGSGDEDVGINIDPATDSAESAESSESEDEGPSDINKMSVAQLKAALIEMGVKKPVGKREVLIQKLKEKYDEDFAPNRCDADVRPAECGDTEACDSRSGTCIPQADIPKTSFKLTLAEGRIIYGTKANLVKLQKILGGDIEAPPKTKGGKKPKVIDIDLDEEEVKLDEEVEVAPPQDDVSVGDDDRAEIDEYMKNITDFVNRSDASSKSTLQSKLGDLLFGDDDASDQEDAPVTKLKQQILAIKKGASPKDVAPVKGKGGKALKGSSPKPVTAPAERPREDTKVTLQRQEIFQTFQNCLESLPV